MKPSVFIIESVTFDDESAGRVEGRILTDILRLAGKQAEYRYIRTKKELEIVLKQFAHSSLRYLHISCHGNSRKLAMTLDDIPFGEFGSLVQPHLQGRRLFLSACAATNSALASNVIPDSGCYSVIGPATTVEFGDAAIMWASFYHLIFRLNPAAIKRQGIKEVLAKIQKAFEVPFRYFSSSRRRPGFREVDVSD